MIKREDATGCKVKVTFALPYEEGQPGISLVGDFNDWNPSANRLVKRRNGTASVAVTLEKGKTYRFRYYRDDDVWLNDREADDYEFTEHGSENCLLRL